MIRLWMILVMIVSRCCKHEIYLVDVNENFFYNCGRCHLACDTMFSLQLTMEGEHDQSFAGGGVQGF